MNIPILGGNTLFDEVYEPRCSLTVVGQLLLDEPIRDSGAKKGDGLILLGEPIWGSREERIKKAQLLFKTWYSLLNQKIKINAGKDVTKGGLVSAAYEIAEKSGRTYELSGKQPYSTTRNLDNFLISVPEKSISRIQETCKSAGCRFESIGKIF